MPAPFLDPDVVIRRLNDLLKTDREAVQALVEHRVPCNEDMLNHPTAQVVQEPGMTYPRVGMLGILNGLVGTQNNGRGYIAAHVEEDGVLSHFARDDD